MRLTDERIAQLQALCDAATPGPWRHRMNPDIDPIGFVEARKVDPSHPYNIQVLGEDDTLYPTKGADVIFIAAVREALPDALADLVACRALLRQCEPLVAALAGFGELYDLQDRAQVLCREIAALGEVTA